MVRLLGRRATEQFTGYPRFVFGAAIALLFCVARALAFKVVFSRRRGSRLSRAQAAR